jgi:surface protein
VRRTRTSVRRRRVATAGRAAAGSVHARASLWAPSASCRGCALARCSHAVLEPRVRLGQSIRRPNVCSSFVTQWSTIRSGASNSSQIRLPLESSGTYNFVVQWGDGANETITFPTQGLHTYASAGRYNVSIVGTLVGWRFNNGGDRLKLLDVMQWGTMRLGNNGGYFYGCENVVISAIDAPDPSGTTNLAEMFRGAVSMNSAIGHWDVSGVTSMRSMFQGASSFNQVIVGWNVSSVTDMEHMFYGAMLFNQPIGAWDVLRVESMEGMFASATAFNQPIGEWDVSSVVTMESAFAGASSFNRPIGESGVTTMAGIFVSATSFNQPIGEWDVSSVVTMESMFAGSSSFNQPVGEWDVSSVVTMESMFEGASKFSQPLGGWRVTNLLNARNVFSNAGPVHVATKQWCETSPRLCTRTMWDTSRTSSGSSTSQQIRLPLESGGTYNFVVQWGDGTSETITSPTQGLHTYASAGWYNVSIVGTLVGWRFNNGGDRLKLLDVMQWGTMRLGNNGRYFHGCANMVISAVDAPDLTGTTSLEWMFHSATFFNSPIGHWDVSSVTNMYAMFAGASSFNQPIGGWNVSAVSNMWVMFYKAAAFNQPIGGWDASSVTNMASMFYVASSFNQPIGGWDVSRVTNMESLFSGASVFTQDISRWCVSRIPIKPVDFDLSTSVSWSTARKPVWGTCPTV